MQFLKKITTKGIGLDARTLDDLADGVGGKAVPIARFYGFVSDREHDKSDIGDFMRNIGQFEAENLLTGEKYRSQQLLVPEVAQMIIDKAFDSAIKALPKDKNAKVAAQIALELSITENTSGKGGRQYIFGVKPLIETQEKDALSLMADEFPKAITDKTPAGKKK
jgi:hypothetical protein